jgi:hypothetical protein
MYENILGCTDVEVVHNEYMEWKEICSHYERPPSTLLETLDVIPSR